MNFIRIFLFVVTLHCIKRILTSLSPEALIPKGQEKWVTSSVIPSWDYCTFYKYDLIVRLIQVLLLE